MSSVIKVDAIQNQSGTSSLSLNSNGIVTRSKVPAWYFTTGNAHGSHSGGTAHNPLNWGFRRTDTDGAGGTMIKTGVITHILIPVTGLYWVSYGGIKGSSSSTVGRMQMNRSTGTGDSSFPQCRGEENSPYAEMCVAFVCNAVAGDEWYMQTIGDGMWMGGDAASANGHNDPFWTGYLIG